MSTLRAARGALLLLVCGLAAVAALVNAPSAGSSGVTSPTASPTSTVAGTVSTRMTIDRFRAVGRKVVGQGTTVSTWRDANGTTTVKRKHFWVALRGSQKQAQQAGTVCQILFLQIGEVDLTLAGLHVVLRPADPTQPIQLTLTADDTKGILGRLFCQLAQSRGVLGTPLKAKWAARQLNKRLHRTTFLRVRATIYAPSGSPGGSTGLAAPQGTLQDAECPVLHLVLGPLHLELLGLIADLNKVILDVTAIPGTLLGNIFCQLVAPPPPPPPAPVPTPARVSG